MSKVTYYSLDKVLKKNAQYNVIYGKRSNGKTYAALLYGLKQYIKTGAEIAYIRRWGDELKGKRGQVLFDAIVENGEVEKLTDGLWTDIYYYGSRWYLCRYNTDDKGNRERVQASIPFCYGFSLNAMEHDKSTSYPRIKTLIFDEFLTRKTYLNDEFIIFMNVVSTIVRSRVDVKIFMLGNSVNKYCPYFAEMGLKNIKTQRQGTIDVYSYGSSKLKVAVEYVRSNEGTNGKDGNILFAFNNPKLQMVTHGTWEIDIYPHLPFRYKKDNVVFEYFIVWDGEILHCEILNGGYDEEHDIRCYCTFVHQKTTDIRYPEKDIIFSQESNPLPNYYTKITRPVDRISEKILSFFKKDKVFFQNNEVGEILFNYLKWCKNS